MSSVKITSYNCQGLGNNGKRIDVFQHLKEIESDIYCLVDTHFTPKEETFISLQWGSDCVFNSKSSNSRGIAILFNSNLDYKIHDQVKEDNANYLILDISVQNNRFILAVIYGPNNDNPQLFKSFFEDMDKFENDSMIICGDFNLVLDPKLDYCNYKQINNKKARQILLEEMEARNLGDPFRILYPQKRRYTWRRKTPFQQSRLDFFLVSEDFQHYVNKCDIGISYRSDHSLVMLELSFQDIIKGKPLWKHNNSLLNDIDYINTINDKIKQVKQQYALPVYNLENIDNIPNEEIQFVVNDQLFLETLLMELRGKSISFSSFKKKQKDQKELELKENIKTIEANLTEDKQEQLEGLKSDLEKLRHDKMKGYVIRSRAQWVEEGEKPSKFFCSLENRNLVNKTMYKLNSSNGEIIHDQFQILDEAKTFYSNLYKNSDTELQDMLSETYLQDNTIPKLNNKESNTLEGDITLEEASITLRNMSNNKSPGSDGFSSEFFKVFWQKLGHFVVRSLNYGFHSGELSITQREGIITCIPKENKPREFLRNWRPITLLNVVFKIASGCIANRIKPVLNKLIHTDQTGFISGRF
ncbi:MAG: endonuclease/exonuclease/phosphatase family protein, partial [Candidatus Thiodiazotropha sp.]